MRDPELAFPKPRNFRQWWWHVSGLPYWIGEGRLLIDLARGKAEGSFYGNDRQRQDVVREARLILAIYAAVLGLVLLSPADGFLVGEHGLQLADKLAGGKAALWCLCMVSLSTILAFFSGRLSARWHKTEMLLRACA